MDGKTAALLARDTANTLKRMKRRQAVAVDCTGTMLYFVGDDDGGPVKIGVTTCPDKRLAALQTASATKLRFLLLVPGSRALERQLHKDLAMWRLQGEWFRRVPEVNRAMNRVPRLAA